MLVITLITRKAFTVFFPTEYLGYDGLFTSIFGLLSLTDLGIQELIMYRLMQSVGTKNVEKSVYYMNVYKQLYKIIGIIITFISIALIPFLPYIINGDNYNWNYIYIVYFFQLGSTLCTYFLAYKRIILVVSQQEYRCVIVETVCRAIANIIRILVIIFLKNYLLYIAVNLICTLISNIIIYAMANKSFPETKAKVKITLSDVKAEGFFTDIKNGFISKFSGVIYGASDNIVISMFLGLEPLAMLSNYTVISGNVQTLVIKILSPFQAAIGDKIYSTNDKSLNLFFMLDRIGFIIAATVCTSYIALFNDFISLWLGNNFLLSTGFVVFFSLNQYVSLNHQFLLYYRTTFGKYELDRNFILAGTLLNVVISALLAKPFGMTGIMIGTLIGNIGFWVGRTWAVYNTYLDSLIFRYIKIQIVNFITLFLEIFILFKICQNLPDTILFFVIKVCLCVTIPTAINCLRMLFSPEGTLAKDYIKNIFSIIFDKIKQKKS